MAVAPQPPADIQIAAEDASTVTFSGAKGWTSAIVDDLSGEPKAALEFLCKFNAKTLASHISRNSDRYDDTVLKNVDYKKFSAAAILSIEENLLTEFGLPPPGCHPPQQQQQHQAPLPAHAGAGLPGAGAPLPVGAGAGAVQGQGFCDQADVWPDAAFEAFLATLPSSPELCKFRWQRSVLDLTSTYKLAKASLPNTLPVVLSLQQQIRQQYVHAAFPDPGEALMVNAAKSLFDLRSVHHKPFDHYKTKGRFGFGAGRGSGRGDKARRKIPPGAKPYRPCKHCNSPDHFDFHCPKQQ